MKIYFSLVALALKSLKLCFKGHQEKQVGPWNLCEMCMTEKAGWKCVECKQYLCNNCKVTHLRVPLCQDHQITSADTDKPTDRLVFYDNEGAIPILEERKKNLCRKRDVAKHISDNADRVENTPETVPPEIEEFDDNKQQKKHKCGALCNLLRNIIFTSLKMILLILLVHVVTNCYINEQLSQTQRELKGEAQISYFV